MVPPFPVGQFVTDDAVPIDIVTCFCRDQQDGPRAPAPDHGAVRLGAIAELNVSIDFEPGLRLLDCIGNLPRFARRRPPDQTIAQREANRQSHEQSGAENDPERKDQRRPFDGPNGSGLCEGQALRCDSCNAGRPRCCRPLGMRRIVHWEDRVRVDFNGARLAPEQSPLMLLDEVGQCRYRQRCD